MRLSWKVAAFAFVLSVAACANTQGPTIDPMPPMPADVRALLAASDDEACGRPASRAVRRLEPGGHELIAQGRRGWVVISATIGTDGSVMHSEIVASAPAGLFDRYAKTLIDTGVYQPPTEECTTVIVVWMGNPTTGHAR